MKNTPPGLNMKFIAVAISPTRVVHAKDYFRIVTTFESKMKEKEGSNWFFAIC